MSKFYLGIDQGTTGTTALLLDETWNVVARGYKEHTQYYPELGWVEHDPVEIWNMILQSVEMALEKANASAEDIKCIGIDNQGETVMLWNKVTGEPVYNAIVWQDRRTAELADEINEKYGELIREKTGLIVVSYFSSLKIKWIIDNIDGVEEGIEKGDIIAGTLDSWIIWKLTNGQKHITDYSTASRTMLLNIHTKEWDDDILDILNIPKSILPEIRNSSEVYGYTNPSDFLGAKVPIAASLVDQQAALFGQACLKKGTVKTTYGTGCFMFMNTGEKVINSKNGLLPTIAWSIDDKITFALDAGIYIAGAAIQWLRDGIKIIKEPSETDSMAKSVEDTGGVYFVPAFSGLAAPYWDQYATGLMVGITGGTTREHIVRATLESIAYQVKDNLDVMMKDSNIDISCMRVDGGMVNNDFLMQFQADILGIPIDVPIITETTALGAAYMAALAIGDFKDIDDLYENWKLKKRYEPKMSNEKRNYLINKWHDAVERSRKWGIN